MRRIAALAVLALGLAACNDNGINSVGPNGDFNASFNLRTINGQSLPVTFTDGSTVVNDVLTFRSDGTFSDASQFSDGSVGVESGFYQHSGNTISFVDQQTGEQFTASVSGTVLTEFVAGFTEVFEEN